MLSRSERTEAERKGSRALPPPCSLGTTPESKAPPAASLGSRSFDKGHHGREARPVGVGPSFTGSLVLQPNECAVQIGADQELTSSLCEALGGREKSQIRLSRARFGIEPPFESRPEPQQRCMSDLRDVAEFRRMVQEPVFGECLDHPTYHELFFTRYCHKL